MRPRLTARVDVQSNAAQARLRCRKRHVERTLEGGVDADRATFWSYAIFLREGPLRVYGVGEEAKDLQGACSLDVR
jgi:hypothetical protein